MTKKKSNVQKKTRDFAAAISKLEKVVASREFGEIYKALGPIFQKVESQDWSFGGRYSEVTPGAEAQATRVAAALTQIIVDPDYRISRAVFQMLSRYKRTVSQIFETSGYRGTGHLVLQLGELGKDGSRSFAHYEVPKLLAGISINALTPELLRGLLQVDKDLSYTLLLGFLSEQMLYSERAETMRGQLLARSDHWQDVTPDAMQLQAMGPAYMGCSYALAPHKHDIKRAFNTAARRWLLDRGAKDTTFGPKRITGKKPVVVIMAEFYHKLHAMHRCYGPSIKALRSRFHTVLIVPEDGDSPEIRALADEVDTFEFNIKKAETFIERIQSYSPDILYMPSVGMRLKSIAASVMRIAPIQVMSFGHPATTKSKAMDYVVLAEDQVGSLDTIDETVILRPSGRRHGHRSDAKPVAPTIRMSPDKIRIAVPAWSRKITPHFLSACKAIAQQAKRPVEYWFFPNALGALHQAIERRYTDMLPCKVLPRYDYNKYVECLNECDIFLSTFPFGATNGILDASVQGLPIVNLRGPEVHTFNDSHLVKKLHQPGWLTTDSADDFVKAVVRLVDDDVLRVQISRNILDGNPQKAFLMPDGEATEDMVEIFEALYYFHDDIQASSKRSVHYKDLMKEMRRKKKMKVSLQTVKTA